MYTVEIRHNFEAAHRLSSPQAPRKCVSIHGHSWWVTVTLAGERLDADGMLVEFGAFKRAWRGWLDTHVDHHLVLRRGDPMAAAVRGVDAEARVLELDESPTTEVMAAYLFARAEEALAAVAPDDAGRRVWVQRVFVEETRVNAAGYERPASG